MAEHPNIGSRPLLSRLYDSRVECWSLMTEATVDQYLKLAEIAYQQRGGLKHQREALKTTTGRRIRERMVQDIKRGAVLPPIVIGVVSDDEFTNSILNEPADVILQRVAEKFQAEIAIIDGMQRTTALLDAVEQENGTREHIVRLEVWIAKNTDSLIYRMLILNTGQVPWNLKQQLQVVYEPLVNEISKQVNFGRFLAGKERRWKGGEFSPDSLIEAYIAFGLRRTEVDTQESLADEFSRLDMAEALTSRKYDQFFYPVIQMMVDFDVAISRFDAIHDVAEDAEARTRGRKEYTRGRHIFDTQPARIGYVVAHAVNILGRIGMDKGEAESAKKLRGLRESCSSLISRIDKLEAAQLSQFLALDVLAERLSRKPTSAVGRWERSFFESAFKVLIEEDYNVPSLETCWRA